MSKTPDSTSPNHQTNWCFELQKWMTILSCTEKCHVNILQKFTSILQLTNADLYRRKKLLKTVDIITHTLLSPDGNIWRSASLSSVSCSHSFSSSAIARASPTSSLTMSSFKYFLRCLKTADTTYNNNAMGKIVSCKIYYNKCSAAEMGDHLATIDITWTKARHNRLDLWLAALYNL